MTNIERRMAFVHAILCSMNNDMNWLCGLVCRDRDNEDWSEDMKELKRLVNEASESVERAHLEAQRLVNSNTVWPEKGKGKNEED